MDEHNLWYVGDGKTTHWQTGQRRHSILDLVFPTMELEPHVTASRLDDPAHATASDHAAIWWMGNMGVQPTESQPITRGWAMAEWLADANSRRAAEQEWSLRCTGRPPLGDACDIAVVQAEAEWLREQLMEMLDWHARKIKVTAHSKRWWGPEIKAARQSHGQMRQQWQEGSATEDYE
jgi:hypothetical protein